MAQDRQYLPVYRHAEPTIGFPALGMHVERPEDIIHRHDEVPRLNRRSRDRHDPGDGNYRNRWVMSKGVETSVGVYLSYENEVAIDQGSAFLYPVHHYVQWNSQSFFRAYCFCRTSQPGYHEPWWICSVVGDVDFDGTVSLPYSGTYRIGATGYYANGSSIDIPLGPASKLSEYAAVSEMKALKGVARTYTQTQCRFMDSRMRYVGCEVVDPDLKFSPEMDGFEDRVDLLPHFGLDGAMASAFTQAVDGLPNLDSMNNIANGLELLGLLKSALAIFVNPTDLSSIGKAGDAWLAYRYSYCTTRADVNEAASYMDRILDLVNAKRIRSNGQYTQGEWKVRCSITLETDAFAGLRSTMEKYGVALTGYNAWDMVPYSFVVDWFLDVGGLLEQYESRNIAMRVKDRGAWFSVERRWVNEFGFDEVFYYRYFATPNLAWCSRKSHSAKTVTWLKRSLDAMALFF